VTGTGRGVEHGQRLGWPVTLHSDTDNTASLVYIRININEQKAEKTNGIQDLV